MEKPGTQFVQGRLLVLDVRTAGSRVWLGPAWAALCGAVASRQLAIDWHSVLPLFATLLVVDSFLGTAWSVAESDRWTVDEAEADNPGREPGLPALPYTLPGSSSYRFRRFLTETISRWRTTLWPLWGSSVLDLTLSSAFALLVAALLGFGPLVLTIVALLVTVCRLVLLRSQQAGTLALGSCVLAGLPWLMGYAAFGQVTFSTGRRGVMVALLLAGLYALAFYSYQLLSRERAARGAVLLNLAQAATAGVLVIQKQPILAGMVGLLLLPQVLLQGALVSGCDGMWYLRRVQVFTMGAMMAAAVGTAI